MNRHELALSNARARVAAMPPPHPLADANGKEERLRRATERDIATLERFKHHTGPGHLCVACDLLAPLLAEYAPTDSPGQGTPAGHGDSEDGCTSNGPDQGAKDYWDEAVRQQPGLLGEPSCGQFVASLAREAADSAPHFAHDPSRAIVPFEAFDLSHPDHEEWVGADNSRCLAPECALHHDQKRDSAPTEPNPWADACSICPSDECLYDHSAAPTEQDRTSKESSHDGEQVP